MSPAGYDPAFPIPVLRKGDICMSIVYVGLDLGSSSFQQVAIKTDGSIKVNRDFRTSEANLVKAFSDLKGEIHVHLEAGELAPWAISVIAPLVTRVVCSHPKDNAWIAKDADKCDRVDAYKLARRQEKRVRKRRSVRCAGIKSNHETGEAAQNNQGEKETHHWQQHSSSPNSEISTRGPPPKRHANPYLLS